MFLLFVSNSCCCIFLYFQFNSLFGLSSCTKCVGKLKQNTANEKNIIRQLILRYDHRKFNRCISNKIKMKRAKKKTKHLKEKNAKKVQFHTKMMNCIFQILSKHYESRVYVQVHTSHTYTYIHAPWTHIYIYIFAGIVRYGTLKCVLNLKQIHQSAYSMFIDDSNFIVPKK